MNLVVAIPGVWYSVFDTSSLASQLQIDDFTPLQSFFTKVPTIPS